MKFKLLVFLTISVILAIPLIGGEGETERMPAAFASPIRLVNGPGNHLFVTDHELRRVIEIKARTLEEVDAFLVDGKPLGLAFLDNRIYVGNASRRRVEVFSRQGDLLYDLGGPLAEVLQPTDIDVDPVTSRVFVVDGLARVIKIFDVGINTPTGNLIGTIPPNGADPLVLSKPTGIAVDLVRSEILVSDHGDDTSGTNARIQVFDYAGNLVYSIPGAQGWFSTRFSRPQGLLIDGDNVIMTDSLIGRVMILDRNTGATLKTFATFGSAPGELRLPLDLVKVGNQDDVFVTNNGMKRIEVFPGEGRVP